jgi:hypothetical protein
MARKGRESDDRDVAVRTAEARRSDVSARASSAEIERRGRDEQRRATAYGRARGQL